MNELVVLLSRIQFAFTVGFHFLMVPLTIGLILFVAIFELLHVKTGKDMYRQQANFWGNLFAINFVFGVVTGITMEIQFGTNWAEYSKFMGDIFGSPLAIEALTAFFLESTFAGIWIFYRHKISPGFRAVTAVLILIGTHISAIWIITANGFMQNPVGYSLAADGSKVVLESFRELSLNPYALFMLLHTITACYLLGAFFMIAVSGYHLLRKSHVDFFSTSVRFAMPVLLIVALLQPAVGHFYGQYVGRVQPAKAAAFELVWETQSELPLYLVQIPLPAEERNIDLFPIPWLGSIMYGNTPSFEVVGIKDATSEWTTEMQDRFKAILPLVHFSFRGMTGLGLVFILLAAWGMFLLWRKRYEQCRLINRTFLWLLVTPWVAIMLGWIVAEVGRQPWAVYGLMLTADAVSSNVTVAQVLFSLISIFVFYAVLLVILCYLVIKFVKRGPIADPFNNRG